MFGSGCRSKQFCMPSSLLHTPVMWLCPHNRWSTSGGGGPPHHLLSHGSVSCAGGGAISGGYIFVGNLVCKEGGEIFPPEIKRRWQCSKHPPFFAMRYCKSLVA